MGLDENNRVIGRDPYRIICLSMVKNEQDIIEPFIKHNARLLDCMVIVDNASVDDTRRIAIDCAREMRNVIVTDSIEFGYFQAERMTQLVRYCQTAFFADFVLLLDADEILSVSERSQLVSALEHVPPGGSGRLPWRTFVLLPGLTDAMRRDPPRTMCWRRAVETPAYCKVALRLDGTYRADLQIEQGNHQVATASGEFLPHVDLDLPLLHFPVRSYQQLASKGVVGWMAYLARNPNARTEIYGFQWAEAFDRITATPSISEPELCEISLRYAQDRLQIDWQNDVVEDPQYFQYDRRHSNGAFADPLSVIARSWERSLSPSIAVSWKRPDTNLATTSAIGTSFDAVWHWDNLFVDLPPFRYIAEKYRPVEVLDIGCGVGAYLDFFKRFGAQRVLGIDGIPRHATVLQPDEYEVEDLSCPLRLHGIFDLVISVEVAEHLEGRQSHVLLESIARHASKLIVFSAAEPGQPGHGHINCQPISYWLDLWADLGWVPDLIDSLGTRCLASMSWFRRNLVVLRRGNRQEGADSIAALSQIGRRQFQWYAQSPGVRSLPFIEPLPDPPAGYSS